MKLERILNLLRYDWSLYKRNYLMSVCIFAGLFLIFGTITFLWQLLISDPVSPNQAPAQMVMYGANFSQYAEIIMVLLVTVILHHKFTNPRTATAYLTLPGTTGEKLTVMIIDYIVGYLTVRAIMWIGLALYFLIGALVAPDFNWGGIFGCTDPIKLIEYMFIGLQGTNNIPNFSSADIFAELDKQLPGMSQMMTDFLNRIKWWGYITAFVNLFIYMSLNLCFKKNGQFKAIASYIGITIVIMIFFILHSALFFAHLATSGQMDPNAPLEFIRSIFQFALIYSWISPFLCAGFIAILHCQIKKKQPF
ncbi:MAG: hypothetical protein Q4B58_02190 [Bacteroidales bacterium]|nr:hypothetical protein [Bacteroidales bacterium]